MARHGLDTPKLQIRLVLGILLILTLFFLAEFGIDYVAAPEAATDLERSVAWSRSHVANISRALLVLSQLVITAIALAIPLTSTIYTPKFTEVFLLDRVNQFVLGFFVFGAGNAIFVDYWLRDGFVPTIAMTILEMQLFVAVAILLPYYYYMFRTIDPSNITAVLAERAENYLEKLAHEGTGSMHEKTALRERLHHLGNIVLRSLERSDRDVALEAIGAIHRVLRHYILLKDRFPEGWERPERDHFPGLSDRAFQFLKKDGTWIERTSFHQLEMAYKAALTRLPDVTSGIASTVGNIAAEANREDDLTVLKLAIRYLNTFTREALKKRDLGATYDTFEHYGRLAQELLGPRPDVVCDIARYFKYYGELAAATGTPFVSELVGYDLAQIVESAYELRADRRAELLEILLSLVPDQRPKSSLRLTKAKVLLAAYFRAAELSFEAERVTHSLEDLPITRINRIERDFANADDPQFWEINNRQANLDYVHPDRLPHVHAILETLRKRKVEAEANREETQKGKKRKEAKSQS